MTGMEMSTLTSEEAGSDEEGGVWNEETHLPNYGFFST